MTPADRRELARALAALDSPRGCPDSRRRRLGVLSLLACAVLAGWIVVLALTLHRHYTATHWRLAWVGFDFFLLGAFAATGWASWRGRPAVVGWLLVTGTLLACDAWFDVILDLGTPGIWLSVASAFIEVPLALVMLTAAGRAVRGATFAAAGRLGRGG